MDSIKEFLESSTIHGLVYISSAPSKLAKVFWLLVVVAGFSCSIYMINDSYVDWQASPIATSISTHPISQLDFPTITVCPPEGSNTALNYDLVRARNITLTDRDREVLINLTRNMFIQKPTTDFVKLARAILDEESILELFDPKPSLSYPIPSSVNEKTFLGYEIFSSQLNGNYNSPVFGLDNSCDQTFTTVRFELLLPLAVMKESKDAILELHIEANNNTDWQVEYIKGAQYFLYKEKGKKNWQQVNEFCTKKKGYLATIENPTDFKVLEENVEYFKAKTWIGGSDLAKEDVWVWTDRTPLPNVSCGEAVKKHLDWSQPC